MLIADSFEGSGVWDSLSLQLLHGAKDQEGFLEALRGDFVSSSRGIAKQK